MISRWKTRVLQERLGGLDFRIEALASLDATIDELFAELTRTGNPQLLEDLCPYFGTIWPSARALCTRLSETSIEKDGGIRILEVGCGLALPSLLLARQTKYSKIVATDFHPEVHAFLARNLELNAIAPDRVDFRNVDWRLVPKELGVFDFVIGSDILYEKEHPGDLAEALVTFVKPKGRILIADPARPYLQKFVDEMTARGWGSTSVVTNAPWEDGKMKEIFLLDFKFGGRALRDS